MEKAKPSIFVQMSKKFLGLLLIFFLVFGSSCKVIYHNRVPVVKAKKRYGWYNPKFKNKKRTKVVWMKVQKGKTMNQKQEPVKETFSETPSN